ncbi:unnamed protein product [Miscanthus lutarioriparius]|uniref:DUF4220 domain-containing protein n=1 Tax=Miscanthus lutarioriparius TaxID=422564 RepID=A0A811Q2E1_9POAL|nr:unnamed protein product [Miscanthus lutarioriparius]
MGLSHAVHWWQEWQMRVLVLGSLFVYVSLYFANSVAVALYVFCNWWSGERQLLNAAVLLFVVGIIKFSYKPWSLKQASFNNMLEKEIRMEMERRVQKERRVEKEGRIGWCWRWCTTYFMDIISPDKMDEFFSLTKSYPQEPSAAAAGAEGELGVDHIEKDEESELGEVGRDVTSLGEFVRSARWHLDRAEKSEKIKERFVFTLVSFLFKMFVNVPRPYSDRLQELKFFLLFSHSDSYKLLQECIYGTFLILYTKRRVTVTLLGTCLQLSLPFLTLTSVVLFAKSHKGGYDVNDVWVTYMLFCFTAMHEFFPFVPFYRKFHANWHEMVSQGSLMSFCACQEATGRFIWPYHLREYVIKHWHVKQEPAARDITDRVRKHVKDGWNSYIYGPISYRGFNNLRGQWTLNKHKHKMDTTGHVSDLASSLMAPFDESVLMWHVATDLCYCEDKSMFTAAAAAAGDEGSCTNKTRQHNAYLSRKISKYMAYLLFIRPEMLLPGARSGLFNIVSDHIAAILEKSDSKGGVPMTKAQGIAQRVIKDILPPSKQGDNKFSHLLIHAKKIAEALRALGADDRLPARQKPGTWWGVPQLCLAALSAMGLETLADKIIMTGPPGDEERRKEQEEEEEAIREKERKESAARASARPEIYVDHIITEEISS